MSRIGGDVYGCIIEYAGMIYYWEWRCDSLVIIEKMLLVIVIVIEKMVSADDGVC